MILATIALMLIPACGAPDGGATGENASARPSEAAGGNVTLPPASAPPLARDTGAVVPPPASQQPRPAP